MKKSLPLIAAICLFTSTTVLAQDTLMMTNGAVIPSKVLEVSTTEIKYKKSDNPDGPTFVTSKSDVAILKYFNGSKDTLNVMKPKQAGQPAIAKPVVKETPKLYPVGAKYMYGDQRITENEMYAMLLEKKDPELRMYVKKAKTAKGMRFIGLLAIPALAGGVAYTIIEATGVGNPNASGGPASATRDYTPGIAFVGVGVACLTTGIVFSSSYKNNNRKAVKLYNQKY
jgi:hypothetical protein